jgi:MFS family permease
VARAQGTGGPTSGAGSSWLGRNVIAIGLVSLFTDAATEMVIPLLPAFLTVVLGAGALSIAWLEGLADATAALLKLMAGRWSDRTGRRRPFMLAGYGLSSVVRPLVAITTAAWQVVGVRVADRIGKGLRSSPRDALLADSVPEAHRGAAFGFHRGMDHAGAVIGPLAAVAVLTLWTDDLRTIFWLTAIPGALAVLTIVLAVSERRAPAAEPASAVRAIDPPSRRALARVLVPIGAFTLGNASDLFLLLYAGGHQVPLVGLPLLWMALHVVKSIVSPLGGALGDRFGHRVVIATGWAIYTGVYVAFAFTDDPRAIAALFVVYGLHHGLTEGPEKALVAGCVAPGLRGGAFGWYHLTVGLLSLPASLLFAILWESVAPRAAFVTGAGFSLVAIVLLALLARPSGSASHAVPTES